MKVGIVLSLLVAITINEKSLGIPLEKEKLNNRPTIALLSELYPRHGNHSYIAASYVKYLESAGARVVPILHNMNPSKIEEIFTYVNGVLYPGGGVDWFTSPYYKHAKHFLELAIKSNDNGKYFPVWATCLGFEGLHVILANSITALSRRRSSDVSLPLKYTAEAKTSKLFKGMSKDLFKALGTEDLAYNHHGWGVAPETYQSTPVLKKFFKILSTNVGEKGQEFVSTVEAYKYPIYGTQWHPEKNNFEFTTYLNNIPHTSNAVKVSQYMANFFVNEARKSSHKFPTKEMEEKYLIYRYTTIYSGAAKQSKGLRNFEQVYIF